MTAEVEEVFGPEGVPAPALLRVRAGHGVAMSYENGQPAALVAAVALALDDTSGGAFRVSMTSDQARAVAAVLVDTAERAETQARGGET